MIRQVGFAVDKKQQRACVVVLSVDAYVLEAHAQMRPVVQTWKECIQGGGE